MADLINIAPAKGRRVRREDGQLLEEQHVEWSPFWQRRLDDGDVEVRAVEPVEKKGR